MAVLMWLAAMAASLLVAFGVLYDAQRGSRVSRLMCLACLWLVFYLPTREVLQWLAGVIVRVLEVAVG